MAIGDQKLDFTLAFNRLSGGSCPRGAYCVAPGLVSRILIASFFVLTLPIAVAHADCNRLMQAITTYSVELSQQRSLIASHRSAIASLNDQLRVAPVADRPALQNQRIAAELSLDRATVEYDETLRRIEDRGAQYQRDCGSE